MIARKDEPIFQELWKNEFRMLPSTFDFIVNLVEADMRKYFLLILFIFSYGLIFLASPDSCFFRKMFQYDF